MGAEYFTTTAKGKTAQEAFDEAVSDAQYEHGHGGYTGTIAEKSVFRVEVPPSGVTPEDYIKICTDYGIDRKRELHWSIMDKWGPACAVKTGDDEWTFFGTASS